MGSLRSVSGEYVYYLCPYKASNPRHARRVPGPPLDDGFRPRRHPHRRHHRVPGPVGLRVRPGHDARRPDPGHHCRARCRPRARGRGRGRAPLNWSASRPPRTGSSPNWNSSAATKPCHPGLPGTHPRPQQRLPRPAHDGPCPARCPHRDDPALLDELPYLTATLAATPIPPIEGRLTALDLQVLYRPEQAQATIWATLTDTSPNHHPPVQLPPHQHHTTPTPQRPAGPVADLPQALPARRFGSGWGPGSRSGRTRRLGLARCRNQMAWLAQMHR